MSPQKTRFTLSLSGPEPVLWSERIEFHRKALALLPDPDDRDPGTAVFIPEGIVQDREFRTCDCQAFRKKTCGHILDLSLLYSSYRKNNNGRLPHEDFLAGPWHKLAAVLGDKCRHTPQKAGWQAFTLNGREGLRIVDGDQREIMRYFSTSADASRLVQRLGRISEEENPSRAEVLDRLYLMTLSDQERLMRERGFKTHRQYVEESVWYRLAYHLFREFASGPPVLVPAVDQKSGDFTLTGSLPDREPLFRMTVPRNKVSSLIKEMNFHLNNSSGLVLKAIPLKSIFKISMNTELDLEVRPMVRYLQENGEERFLESEECERFRYGDLVYLKDLGILTRLESPHGAPRRFKSPVKMVLKKSQIPSFLEEHEPEIREKRFVLDPGVERIRIHRYSDSIEINPLALERDWCWLDIQYGFGDSTVSLGEILAARRENERYIRTADGWLDTWSPEFDEHLEEARLSEDAPHRIGLSRMRLLRLGALSNQALRLTGDPERRALIKRFLELTPSNGGRPPQNMTSTLRPYQELGYQWLFFLYENRLGGLLCDDMGLGKTHQVMALMAGLLERENPEHMLVVCPTTVLSHWEGKIRDHVPDLKAALYHGPSRNLPDDLDDARVILTSYGILRTDPELLARPWELAVFDEIQNLKNSKTKGYQAARDLRAGRKIGLTGTPIENRLEELKSLFDLVLPGYFGTDREFREKYVEDAETHPDSLGQKKLRRLISPFVLRRMKESVLHELPEKIVDRRQCRLSEDQVKLYREALESRGRSLVDVLRRGEEPVPYIHIFALLNLLKQICDHPALVAGAGEEYEQYESGKWELFKEILDECLQGTVKVVVYSQYLKMIDIIADHLERRDVGYATLTGRSRKRGRILSRFAEDPDCRVFIGSLKAGGVGIDLVAASVVIHYDRWWNAAREDQATDRVHRIGQKRGVQVFKLITAGTLEEKIDALIDKKRKLLENAVQEDAPDVLKTYTNEELIDLISYSST